ncbi:DUF6061 family protein [Ruminiclostridium cellobioparum]|uniref:Uncharacterized protein n=1 Tax=Ruminiclostridium cellobioparum subsp. termitidis CT1112 TaxID=1195236 RepID=S0FJ02_RUMCE|nr:DUF6061 family protein [Ruminiclostridium cellobioparum]EMS69084.1 hypothetical protein CTER_5321 [Ruminiclostridium cellobioparum subsp. termitidis CT1112]
MRIKACTCHDENDTIDVVTTDNTKMYLLCAAIENSSHTDMIGRSKLRWLKDKEPATYAEFVVKGDLQDFLDRYAESYHQQQDTMEKQLKAHFVGDKAYAAAMAREIMMYGE